MTRTSLLDRDCVVTDRGGIIENTHGVHIAVTDTRGNVLFSAGNPSRMTLSRSAAKPAQAVAVIETGAMEKYGFDDVDLALMCASHNSEDFHISRAKNMLSKIKAEEKDLQCGGHPAVSEEVNRSWIKAGFEPTGICNNCSGKHVAMMAGAEALGVEVLNYHELDHPMQREVKRVVEELSLDPKQVKWGVDGCNLPAPAYPLYDMGCTFAIFAAAADDVEKSESSTTQRIRNLARVFNAMAQHSEQVGGTGRFCTNLMHSYKGQLFGKVGADACYGLGIRESEDTRRLGAKGPLGIAVKIEDGSLEILYAVVAEVLEQLGIGTAEQRAKLDGFHYLKRKNTMNVVTGLVKFNFKLCA
ncbi:L-asparaginase II [Fusarium flagelliforme]|uniref:Putative l-asparaginase ii n=1 Tax=Fusarium flagelliforme TaxID=2675880 RepID=A0A395MDG9_9HYPO|nr:L-asparaginase II [Fusarium flagelliforme]KAH7197775.1 L-asparaginase II [Fusarium flagelliforme]RFN45886.1 putative l-asparaginase ii [Fusarium flagelliforme]